MAKDAALIPPSAPAFLDPLTEIDNCYFYAVPKFNSVDHPNTRWLLSIMRTGRLDKMKRKMELQPSMFKTSYYQLHDCPQLYNGGLPGSQPLFHRQSVLYVTAVGVAIYLKSYEMTRLLLTHEDPNGDRLCKITDPQYATHVQSTAVGDFHAYPLSVIMLRGGFYASAPCLLMAGWNPLGPICMPLRRRFERRAMYYTDWLDYALHLMYERPMLPIGRLVHHMISEPTLYKYKQLPIEVIHPPSEAERIRTGLLDVDELGEEAKMIGVKSLLEIAEGYLAYLQTKGRLEMIHSCVKQMASEGINPEIMMTHALDYDGYSDAEPDKNFNNNAAAAAAAAGKIKEKRSKQTGGPYVSEPTRILLHAVNTRVKPGNKAPLGPLLEAVAVYIKRNFYLVNQTHDKKQVKGQTDPHKRDARNTATLMLNLIQQQYDRLDRLDLIGKEMKIKQRQLPPDKQHQFEQKLTEPLSLPSCRGHICQIYELTKNANSKRIILTRNVKRISGLLFHVLLHSGEIQRFVRAAYPPYTAGGQVDFRLNPGLEHRLKAIQLEVMSLFNEYKKAPSYLDDAALKRAAVEGTNKSNTEAQQQQQHGNNGNLLLSNLSCCPAKGDGGGESPGGHVTFVKVKRKLVAAPVKQERQEDVDEIEEVPAEDRTPEEGKGDGEEDTTVVAAARLYMQIDQLRKSPSAADVALAEIYGHILEDLRRAADAIDDKERRARLQLTEPPGEQKQVAASEEDADKDRVDEAEAKEEEAEEPPMLDKSDSLEDQDRRGHSDGDTIDMDRHRGAPRRGNRKWRCRARGGGGGGGRKPRRHQMARVFDAKPEGTEFDLDSA